MVPAAPRLHKFHNTVHVQCSNISLITYLLHISKCFPQLFTACLKPKYFTNLPLPTQSPNSKHSHTCYCRIAHKGCTAGIVFPPFCLQKEKHAAFVFPIRSSSLSTTTGKFWKGFLRSSSLCCMHLLWKVTTEITFISVGLLWNAKSQGNFSTKKSHMVKRDFVLVLQYHNSKCVRPQVWSYAHLSCLPPFLFLRRAIVHHWNSVKPLKLGTEFTEFKVYVTSIVSVHTHTQAYINYSNSLQR